MRGRLSRRVVLGGLVAVTAGGPVAARAQEPVTLEAAVRAALSSHPALSAARGRVDAAEAGVGEARAAWLPSLGTQALATRYEEPMVVAPLHGFDPLNPPAFERTLYQGHASAEWTAYDGGARGARIRAAEAMASSADAGLESVEDAVIAEAASAYLRAAAAAEVADASAEALVALEAERGRAAQLLEQGKAPRVMLLRAEAAVSRARAELESARQARILALSRLARVTGLPAERLTGPLGIPAAPVLDEEGVDLDPTEHPDVVAARARAEAAETAVRAARSAYLPRIGLAGRYSAFGSTGTSLQPEWNAGVQVTWPVFTGGARGRAVERAEAEAVVASAEAALVARRVSDAADAALSAWRSAVARVAALEAAAEQSAEVARIEALALEAGAGVQPDYLRAEADLLQVRAALVEARAAVVEARVRLAAATGALTPAWVSDLTREGER